MPVSDIIKAKLLFVDDDRTFLDFISQAFGEFSRNQWEIKCATDAAQALTHLRAEKVDLAVLDLHMPGTDGMQLMRMLKREFPALQIAFLTGQGDEQSRRSSLEEGAALFLEKPASAAGMESLFATINELARWQQRWGERGVVRRASLLDLVKMECKSSNSRFFEVFNADERGQIWIKEGAIIHALAPEKRGQSAFTHLICLPNAEYLLKPFEEPIERSVDRDWEFLVLEAARVQEQVLNIPEVAQPEVLPKKVPPSPARTDAPAAAPPGSEPPLKMAPAEKVTRIKLPAREEARPAEKVSAPAVESVTTQPEPATEQTPTVFPAVASPPATRSLPAEAHPAGLRIEEVLICSDRREVFYEWQCSETQKRLALIEFITHKSRQLAQGLPLGKFDRLEMQSATARVVVHSQQSRNILVRSNTRVPSPAATEAHGFKTVLEWVSQQPPLRGLLACGVALADRRILTQSFVPDLPLSALNTAWPCVADTFDAAGRMQFFAWQLRWIYDRAQLYCVRRPDGSSLGLMLEKALSAVDLTAVEHLFNEFQTLREG